MKYLPNTKTCVVSEVFLGLFCLVCGCAIYLLFRSRTLNLYQWCKAIGLSDVIDTLREHVQNWSISEFIKFSLPDGLYSAAYIFIIDAIWHVGNPPTKYIIILFVPFVAIANEILQFFGFAKGTFDIYDLVCYALPLLIYITIKLLNNNTFTQLKHIRL